MLDMRALAFVRVPVLSEQITVTDPSVSTVFNDLHNTLFFFMIFAVMVRLHGQLVSVRGPKDSKLPSSDCNRETFGNKRNCDTDAVHNQDGNSNPIRVGFS
jgi:hypothetical protein